MTRRRRKGRSRSESMLKDSSWGGKWREKSGETRGWRRKEERKKGLTVESAVLSIRTGVIRPSDRAFLFDRTRSVPPRYLPSARYLRIPGKKKSRDTRSLASPEEEGATWFIRSATWSSVFNVASISSPTSTRELEAWPSNVCWSKLVELS